MRRPFRYRFKRKRRGGWRRNPPLRTILRSPGRARPETKYCEVCGLVTREGKPFCPEHVEEHPYIQRLMAKLEQKRREEERVAVEGPRAISEDSITANELLMHLKIYGGRTVDRLSRELQLPSHVILHYVAKLGDELSISVNARGKKVITIANKGSLRRLNPEYLPANREEVELAREEITENLSPHSILPEAPLVGEIGDNDQLVPRASLDLMITGKFPLIRTPEGELWRVKPRVISALSKVMTKDGLYNVDAWDSLIAACGNSCKLFVMDGHGERYKVVDIDVDFGGETGALILQHLGRRSRGGRRMLIDIHDAYGKMLPFVVYGR